MIKRYDLEKIEDKILAPYACKSKNSKGRSYPEKEDDIRTIFQRDRERIVHSRAFRRLRHKTQVFVASEGDHYRNRLSHSLEVAQISRHISRLLKLNEDLSESIALAHDLGHTPFGHAGENVLNELMKGFGGFEHNWQSKRIVEILEVKYPKFLGLNLSYEIRQGLIKHESPFDITKQDNHKASTILEAEVVNISDEIAYNNHDLDDGLTSGILKIEKLKKKLDIFKEAAKRINREYTNIGKKEMQNLCIGSLINSQVRDVVKESLYRIKKYKIKNHKDLIKVDTNIIDFSKNMNNKNKELRKYLKKVFYLNKRVIKMNKVGEKIIKKLFNYYCGKGGYSFEPRLKEYYSDLPKEREICDYIAGMTDSFAEKEFTRTL